MSHFRSAKYFRAFVQSRTGGENIVYKENRLALKDFRILYGERIFHIFKPFFRGKSGLGWNPFVFYQPVG